MTAVTLSSALVARISFRKRSAEAGGRRRARPAARPERSRVRRRCGGRGAETTIRCRRCSCYFAARAMPLLVRFFVSNPIFGD